MTNFMRDTASKLWLRYPESCADGLVLVGIFVLLLASMFVMGKPE